MARVKKGDVGAYGELVRRHQHAVYGVVSRMIDNRDDVDDTVQEVFVRAFRSMSRFKGEAAFSTWVYRIAVNTTIKQMKKIKSRHAPSIDDPVSGLQESLQAPGELSPEHVLQKRERGKAVREAVLSLPEKHRAVVVLHYFENCGCEEIARILDCSVGTVWSRLHYACKKMQGQLDWTAAEGDA